MSFGSLIKERSNIFESLDFDEPEQELLQSRVDTFNGCRFFSPLRLGDQDISLRSTNSFRLLHQNIRSLIKNGENFKDFLFNTGIPFSVLLVSETWLREGGTQIHIPNYSYSGRNRTERIGGGVGIFVNDCIDFSSRKDLWMANPAIENVSIEINRELDKNIVVTCIYRPPDACFPTFMNEINTHLEKLRNSDKIIFIGGDFNLDLLSYNTDNQTTQFVDLLLSHNLLPSISRPTRVCDTSNTLIDAFFTNYLGPATSGVIIELTLSDHFPIFLDTPLNEGEKSRSNCSLYQRKITQSGVTLFNEWLVHKFAEFGDIQSPDIAVDVFCETVRLNIDHFLPIEKVCRKTTPLKPWITRSILSSINTKTALYKTYLQNKSPENLVAFKVYKNRLRSVTRVAKKKYFQDQLDMHRGNSKKIWKVLNEACGRKRNKLTNIKRLKTNGDIVNNQQDIANILNIYFTTIGPKLAQSAPLSPTEPTSFIHNEVLGTCFLNPVSPETIRNILSELPNKGEGTEPITNRILKLLSPSVSFPLSHLVNICFATSIFPDSLKESVVTPVFKAGDRDDPGNYRPISIISPLSKIIEKCIVERLNSFLKHHDILSSSQYGFRTKHSTEHALLNFIDFASEEKDKGNYVLGIYLDIKKAFDSVNHEILCKKLSKYGIRGNAHRLIHNYLRNRSQKVKIIDKEGKVISNGKTITCGVPQGSVLGPLLFLIYVNDLKNVSASFKTITFADDTNLFLSHRNLTELCNLANKELSKVEDWFACNQLSLNVAKTSYQLYTSKIIDKSPVILINNIHIKNEKYVKFLGVLVDEALSFKKHINYVCKKVALGIGCMFRSRSVLEPSQLISLYNALVLPHLNYCSLVWSINFETNLKRPFLLQKRAARVILGLQYTDSVTARFSEIGIKPLTMLRDLKCMIMIYKLRHRSLPAQLNNIIEWREQDASRQQLRNRGPLIIPFSRTVSRQHTFRVFASKLFNNLNAMRPIHLDVTISKYKKSIIEQLQLQLWN